MNALAYFVLVWTWLFYVQESAAEKKEKTILHIGAFYSMTGQFQEWGPGCLPAAEMAVAHINNRTDILSEYTIKLINMDDQSSPGVASRELFQMLQSPPTKTMILGPFPSHIAMAVAQTARWWHLLQVSPAAFTPELSDRATYPYFFRTRAALTSSNPTRIAFLKHFGWSRVAIIARQVNYFIQTVDILFKELEEANITVVTTEVYQNEDEPVEELARIKRLGARIIFVFAYDEYARKIFCQARKFNMYGRKYVWVMNYGNDVMWMTKPTANGACSAADMLEMAEGLFVTGDVTLREDGTIPLAGMTTRSFIEEYLAFARMMNVTPSEFYAPLTYDGVWSLALALNGSQAYLGRNQTLADFTYENPEMTAAFMKAMDELIFEGYTGRVTFTSDGNVGALITKIQRFVGGQYIALALHDSYTNIMEWKNAVEWEGNRPPFDAMRILDDRVIVSDWLFIMMTCLMICGILLAVGFLGFNFIKRHTKLIRMSSPNLNNMTVFGCILSYVSVIMYGFSYRPLENKQLLFACHAKAILLAVGYSLGFGALFCKTWRVFKIFTNKSAKRIVISDKQLHAIVLGFVVVDMLYFSLWFTMDPLRTEHKMGPPLEGEEDPEYVVRPYVEQCTSSYGNVWQLVMYALKGVLLIFGAFLAWQTKAVSIPALNDSKYIGFAVYNVATVCLLGVPASFLLGSRQVNEKFGITAGCILVCTTVTLCIVFVPKVLHINNQVHTQNSALNNTTGTANQNTFAAEIPSTQSGNICQICKARINHGAVSAPTTS